MRFISFTAPESAGLDAMVNEWLREHPTIQIVSVTQSATEYRVTLCIFYEE